MEQLDTHRNTEAQAASNLKGSRLANKQYFELHKQLRPELQQLKVGDLVLVYIDQLATSRRRSSKLNDRWCGPYHIREIPENSTYYLLEELDGTPLASTFAGNRLQRFFVRIERSGQHTLI